MIWRYRNFKYDGHYSATEVAKFREKKTSGEAIAKTDILGPHLKLFIAKTPFQWRTFRLEGGGYPPIPQNFVGKKFRKRGGGLPPL